MSKLKKKNELMIETKIKNESKFIIYNLSKEERRRIDRRI